LEGKISFHVFLNKTRKSELEVSRKTHYQHTTIFILTTISTVKGP